MNSFWKKKMTKTKYKKDKCDMCHNELETKYKWLEAYHVNLNIPEACLKL